MLSVKEGCGKLLLEGDAFGPVLELIGSRAVVNTNARAADS